MKKLILMLILVFAADVVHGETAVNPKEDGPFEKDRLVTQKVNGDTENYILTDLKTGCQYVGNDGYGHRLTLLGCSPEYISDKFKK